MSSLVGQSLGNYRVLARLGVGGRGEVYRDGDGRIELPPAKATKSPIMLARRLSGRSCRRDRRRLAGLCLQHSQLPFQSYQAIFQVTDLLFERGPYLDCQRQWFPAGRGQARR
jgi:hypothetical protein